MTFIFGLCAVLAAFPVLLAAGGAVVWPVYRALGGRKGFFRWMRSI